MRYLSRKNSGVLFMKSSGILYCGWFGRLYGILTLVGYLIENPVYIYIKYIFVNK